MITIKQILNAFETIQQAKIEEKLKEENKKIQRALNEHYTCYNRCYYLKYSANEKKLLEEIIDEKIKSIPWTPRITEKELAIHKLKTKLAKNKIYWKLINR